MKYSLRSLFVVVTLIAGVLGCWQARVSYLHHWAARYEREWLRLERCRKMTGAKEFEEDEWRNMILAARCRLVASRPWAMIDENAEETREEGEAANADYLMKLKAGIVSRDP